MGAFAGQLLVEGDAPAQHAVEDIGGDPAGGEPRDVRLGGDSRARHCRTIAVNCVAAANTAQKTHRIPGFGGLDRRLYL